MGDAKVSLFVKVEHHKSHCHWAVVIPILDKSASLEGEHDWEKAVEEAVENEQKAGKVQWGPLEVEEKEQEWGFRVLGPLHAL